jgi:hypothetical protein
MQLDDDVMKSFKVGRVLKVKTSLSSESTLGLGVDFLF